MTVWCKPCITKLKLQGKDYVDALELINTFQNFEIRIYQNAMVTKVVFLCSYKLFFSGISSDRSNRLINVFMLFKYTWFDLSDSAENKC